MKISLLAIRINSCFKRYKFAEGDFVNDKIEVCTFLIEGKIVF